MRKKWSLEELTKQVIVDGLEVLKGRKVKCDCLYIRIRSAMNYEHRYSSPAWAYFDRYKDMEEFVKENWEQASEAYKSCLVHGENILNIFEDADIFIYGMVTECLFNSLKEVKLSTDGTGHTTITDEAIASIKEELGLEDIQVSEWLR